MKRLRQFSALFCGVVVGLILASPYAYGFRAEDERGNREAAVKRAETESVQRGRAATVVQERAVRRAQQSGASFVWHKRLNAPAVVRGKDLGRNPAFTGGKGRQLKGAGNYREDAITVLDRLSDVYGVSDANKEFAVKRVQEDGKGCSHVRLSQQFKGLRVVGGELVVHFNLAGEAYEVNGQYVPAVSTDTQPSVSQAEAIRIAQQDCMASGASSVAVVGDVLLVIFARGCDPELAYEMCLSEKGSKRGTKQWRYWVSALTGAVLSK